MADVKLTLVVSLLILVVISFYLLYITFNQDINFNSQLTEKVSSDDDCELHKPNIHDFCCEVYEEDLEFLECVSEWSDKLDFPRNSREEMVMHFCIAECTYNETMFLEGETSLDLPAIKSHLKDNYEDPEDAKLMLSAFEKCEKHGKDMLNHEEVVSLNKRLKKVGCKPYAGLVMECVTNELILNCPHDKWNDSTQCDHAKEFLQKCVK